MIMFQLLAKLDMNTEKDLLTGDSGLSSVDPLAFTSSGSADFKTGSFTSRYSLGDSKSAFSSGYKTKSLPVSPDVEVANILGHKQSWSIGMDRPRRSPRVQLFPDPAKPSHSHQPVFQKADRVQTSAASPELRQHLDFGQLYFSRENIQDVEKTTTRETITDPHKAAGEIVAMDDLNNNGAKPLLKNNNSKTAAVVSKDQSNLSVKSGTSEQSSTVPPLTLEQLVSFTSEQDMDDNGQLNRSSESLAFQDDNEMVTIHFNPDNIPRALFMGAYKLYFGNDLLISMFFFL